ncbi:TetR family transcriptional regulator C-terminal domain-containing protein [Leucobacter chromiireducens]|nr:TetR family transcriptional regulator C-terminal domain-containing protein [Leucobacter chromiireducens]
MEAPRSRARRMSPEARRAQIYAAARELALAEGLHAISKRTLAARLGIAPALVGHYAVSMESLVAETFSAISARELAEVHALVQGADGPRDRLAVLLRALLEGGREDVTAVWADGWSLGRRSEALAQAVHEQMSAWETALCEIVTAGVRAGDFRELDVPAFARGVMGMVDGLNAQALVRRRVGAAREAGERGELVMRVVALELGVDPRAFAASDRAPGPRAPGVAPSRD